MVSILKYLLIVGIIFVLYVPGCYEYNKHEFALKVNKESYGLLNTREVYDACSKVNLKTQSVYLALTLDWTQNYA